MCSIHGVRTSRAVLGVPNLVLDWFHGAADFFACMRGAGVSHCMFFFNAGTVEVRACVTCEVVLSLQECSFLDASNWKLCFRVHLPGWFLAGFSAGGFVVVGGVVVCVCSACMCG